MFGICQLVVLNDWVNYKYPTEEKFMIKFLKKLFGIGQNETPVVPEETIEIVVADSVITVAAPKPKKERKAKAAPKTVKTPKEKLKAKKEATKLEKPTPKKRGRPAKAK